MFGKPGGNMLFGNTSSQPLTASGCTVLDEDSRDALLPLVKVDTHTLVRSSAYTSTLTQTYRNPLESKTIKKLKYTFPLFDGVSVVDFECHIGDRIIKGLVKERHEAKATFEAAAARGETAGLLDQLPEASDVFSTLLSNIPPQSTIQVIIKYVGELKHDMGSDSLRLTIPTAIAPRYGTTSGPLLGEKNESSGFGSTPKIIAGSSMNITVDIDMPESCPIQKISSPTNPIEVSLGVLSKDANAEHAPSKGSATLALEQSSLDKDFILQVAAKDIGAPQALLETHSNLPDQKAVMATFVPKFALKPEKPEIIFIVDRSGSMQDVVDLLRSAMQVCIKSLSPGVRFNILSFGTRFHLLWDKSKVYDATSLKEASRYVERFAADFGGTETLQAVRTAIDSRRPDISTELVLLTDGDIWQQTEFFDYLNNQVEKSKGAIRLFSLGIGTGVSHALLEGCARAGRGFSQSVASGERFDGKIVRMIKGALSPHMTNCRFRLQFDEKDDDFEVVEKTRIVALTEKSTPTTAQPKSLYDPEAEKQSAQEDSSEKSVLPLEPPAAIYAPWNVPALFPFSRTSVYLLLSSAASLKTPKAVVLSADTSQGPLELTISISATRSGAMIHQLAARKSILELEEGRGWVCDAEDEAGKLLKDSQPTRLEDLIRLEGIRLGTRFQVANKWCSFVAVEANSASQAEQKRNEAIDSKGLSSDDDVDYEMVESDSPLAGSVQSPPKYRKMASSSMSLRQRVQQQAQLASPYSSASSQPPIAFNSFGAPAPAMSLFGSSPVPPPPPPGGAGVFGSSASAPAPGASGLFGSAAPPPHGPVRSNFFGSPPAPAPASRSLGGGLMTLARSALPGSSSSQFGSSRLEAHADSVSIDACAAPPVASSFAAPASSGTSLFSKMRLGSSDKSRKRNKMASPVASYQGDKMEESESKREIPLLERIIASQSFDGCWTPADIPWQDISVGSAKFDEYKYAKDMLATALVVTFLEEKMKEDSEAWDLVVDKARAWIEAHETDATAKELDGSNDNVWTKARELLGLS